MTTKAERRRIGRAIRKARREARERRATAAAQYRAVRDHVEEMFTQWREAFHQIAETIAAVNWQEIIAGWERLAEMDREAHERQHRDWMLTHRALTAGSAD